MMNSYFFGWIDWMQLQVFIFIAMVPYMCLETFCQYYWYGFANYYHDETGVKITTMSVWLYTANNKTNFMKYEK